MGKISFDDVLGTNYVPSDNDRCSIKALIESMEQELSSLNHVLLPLLAKRKKLTTSIRAHTALLAPVRRMPPELIREVFVRSIYTSIVFDRRRDWGESERENFPSPDKDEEPLKLGRICRTWREIALSTPSLWSAISIPFAWKMEGLREWILRSGSCTLCFTIQICAENSDHLKLLASYQNRWKDVVFRLRGPDEIQFVPAFLSSLPPNYECLRTLKFGHRTWGAQVRSRNNFSMAFHSAPSLRNLVLYEPVFDIAALNESRTFCLRKINIECIIPPNAFMSLLRQSPQVESIYAQISFSVGAINHETIDLMSLKRLEMKGEYRGANNFCPLGMLHLPALEELCIDITYDDWFGEPARTCVPQVKSMIHRSRPPLKVLRVWGNFGIPPAEIMDCIPLIPCLSFLDLEFVHGGLDGIIELLTGEIPPADDMLSGCMCPQLDRLVLGHGRQKITPESVIKLILSRSVAGKSRVSRVTVLEYTCNKVLADPRIMELIANGLKLSSNEPNVKARAIEN